MNYSFVLIAFNEENTIQTTIESIQRQKKLGTSYEILVMDDGSTDSTAALVTKLAGKHKQIKLLGDGTNHGRGYGRYSGVNAARGDYVIMIDADIVLPSDWLARALPAMKSYDVAGGIAVPDGDVAYVYRRFKLVPKTVMGTTTVTGNNGIYKRTVFKKLNFNLNLREGEDVDFNNRALELGVKEYSVPGLTVEHQEHKSFGRSMQWLYQSGVGATRQFITYGEIRLPDIALAATVILLLTSLLVGVRGEGWWWLTVLVPVGGVVATSFLHLRGRFLLSFRHPEQVISAVTTDSLLLLCYYIGRLQGIVIYFDSKVVVTTERDQVI